MAPTQCFVCETPLSGGIDTFNVPGIYDACLCTSHFHEAMCELRGEGKDATRIAELEREERELLASVTAAQAELDDAEDDLAEVQLELAAARKERKPLEVLLGLKGQGQS